MEPDRAALNDETTPQTPGQILRRRRESRGISYEEAAAATKIGKNYLRALEDDRHGDFASAAYLKGFLRTYATYLGLPADELISMLDPEQPAPVPPASAHREQAEPGRLSWQRLLLPAVLLAIIAVVALLMPSNDPPAVRQTPPKPAPTPVATIQQPVSSAQLTAPTASPETALNTPPAQPASGVTLRIKTLRSGNLVITLDEMTTQPYELTAGDLIEWHAERTIQLEPSDPSIIEIELNGKPIKPTFPAGKPAKLVLTAQGIAP